MSIRAEEITGDPEKPIKGSRSGSTVRPKTASFLSVGDGIARVHGSKRAMAGELPRFPRRRSRIGGSPGRDNVGVVLLGDDRLIKEGDTGPPDRTNRRGAVRRRDGPAASSTPSASRGRPGPGRHERFRRVKIKAPGIVKRQP